MNKTVLKKAFKNTVPVLIGYLVLGFGFGIIMTSKGYGIIWPISMSVFIYAGSMQYAAVSLLTGGASLIAVALTTLAVNARHFFYGISVIDKYKGAGIKKPYMIFALTDETYSLVCTSNDGNGYNFAVSLLDQIYWVGGTALGAIFGNIVKFNTAGIDFALTALFITVFTEQWLSTKKHFSAVIGVLVSVICLLVFGKDGFLIPTMIIITVVLLLARKKEGLYVE